MSETSTDVQSARRILIIDDDETVATGIGALLSLDGWEVATATNPRDAYRLVGSFQPEVALVDLHLGDASGLDVLEQIKAFDESIAVVMISGLGTIDAAVKAIRLGAESFIAKPFSHDQLNGVLAQAMTVLESKRQLAALRRRDAKSIFIGASPAARAIDEMLERAAPAPSPVLLQGESGSGKGVVAKLIHERSPRAKSTFVDLNCAGLSAELLEAELFGYEKGAFTGAASAKPGLLEVANGGTVFLDEIGEMDILIQARLLKALEEKTFRRLGGVRAIRSDFRLVTATNRDLAEEVARNRFRKDLYYRLNVVRIIVPPLRQRREDVPLLIEALLTQLGSELGVREPKISDLAVKKLMDYDWPGNVRELRNTLERALLASRGGEIRTEHLALESGPQLRPPADDSDTIVPLDDMIADYMRRAVELCDGNMREAAKRLGVSRSTLYARLKPGDRANEE